MTISFCYAVPRVLLLVHWTILLHLCIHLSSVLVSLYKLQPFSAFIIDVITLSLGAHLLSPFQNSTVPHTCLVLSSQMLADSALVQIGLVCEVLLGCCFWDVVHLMGLLSTLFLLPLKPPELPPARWLPAYLQNSPFFSVFSSEFICFLIFVCFWSASVCLIKDLILTPYNVTSHVIITQALISLH